MRMTRVSLLSRHSIRTCCVVTVRTTELPAEFRETTLLFHGTRCGSCTTRANGRENTWSQCVIIFVFSNALGATDGISYWLNVFPPLRRDEMRFAPRRVLPRCGLHRRCDCSRYVSDFQFQITNERRRSFLHRTERPTTAASYNNNINMYGRVWTSSHETRIGGNGVKFVFIIPRDENVIITNRLCIIPIHTVYAVDRIP